MTLTTRAWCWISARSKKSIKHLIDGSSITSSWSLPTTLACWSPNTRKGCTCRLPLQDGRDIEHRSPRDAVRLIPASASPHRLAQIVTDYLSPQTPDNVSAIRVRLWPEPIDGAFYQYSHGLRHHDGNCQRIAHGHRSRIEILRNGQRDLQLEEQWADSWADIYIGSRADLIGTSRRDGVEYCEFGYRSSQGSFGLTLPKERCYLIDNDSTVENIAQHIADQLKAEHPNDRFKVYAFEGVDKGAIGLA